MSDTEKITINLNAVDLGRIDLLTEEGFYSNRTDFIRSAIRKEIDAHRDVVAKSVTRRSGVIGLISYTRRSLEEYEKKRQKLAITVVGGVHFAKDITPELARRTIESVKIHGILRASPALKAALADRIR